MHSLPFLFSQKFLFPIVEPHFSVEAIMSGYKARLIAGTAILAALSAPVFAQQAVSVRSGDSLDANSIQGMTAPKYSKSTPMGGVDYGDDLGNHQAGKSLDMSAFGIYNLTDPTGDRPDMAANKRYVDQVGQASKDNFGNHTATQNVNMGNFEIRSVGTPTTNNSAATKKYVDDKAAAAMDNLGNHTATQSLDMDANRITDVGTPVNGNDAATKAYVDQVGTASMDNLGNHTATMILNMSGQKITNVAAPTAASDAATKGYVDSANSTINDNLTAIQNRRVIAGTGLGGGGALTSDVTLTFDTSWGDGRYALASRSITAGSGLSGGGNLSANRTLSVDGTVVRTTGAQSIAGVKTFTDGINSGGNTITNLAAPTANTDAANKAYVDSSISTAVTSAAYSAGNGLNLTGREFSVDTGVVATLAGTQTFTGLKSYTRPVTVTENGSQIRLKHITASNSAAILSNSGGTFSVNFTNPGAQDGGANSLLPFSINNTTGFVNMGHGLRVVGGATILGGLEMSASRITNLAAPTGAWDATTKSYVDAAVAGRALTTRTITAGDGLTGGGDLSANRTLAINTSIVATLAGAQTFTGAKTFSAGIVMGNTKITGLAAPTANADAATKAYVDAAVSGAGGVPTARTIATNNGLTGGGDLTANRTIGLTGQALALHNLATNGIIARTGAGTVVGRTVVAGTAIEVTNGNGVAGNITVKLAENNIRRAGGNANAGVLAYNGTAAGTGGNFDSSGTNPSAALRLNYNGYLYATRFYSNMYLYFSDRNLKENIETIAPASGIETVRQANPVSYHWKDTGHKALGLIAQEVEEIIPTAVKTNESGIKSVDYVQMIAPMLAAIQDLDNRVQALEGEAKD